MSFGGVETAHTITKGETARPAQRGPATPLQRGVVVVRTQGGSHTITTKGRRW